MLCLKIDIFNFIRHVVYYQNFVMNTILFLDGSNTSIYLLNLIKKNKFFKIKKIIISPNIKNLVKFKNKNYIKTNFKKKIKIGTYDIGFSYYDFKIPKKILDKIKIGGINFHPSFLPYNRGRHSAFWGIVKNTKLGASPLKIEFIW